MERNAPEGSDMRGRFPGFVPLAYLPFSRRSFPLWVSPGFNIAKALLTAAGGNLPRQISCVQISSRSPEKVQKTLKTTRDLDHSRLLPPHPADVTDTQSLDTAFKGADVVVSLVGLLRGTQGQFESSQWRGAENVAKIASGVGAKLIHFSAIGADVESPVPYWRTKALGERAIYSHCPDATVFRPSIVFGPGDGFFTVCSATILDQSSRNSPRGSRGSLAWRMFFPSCQCLTGEPPAFSPCSSVTWPVQFKE